MLTYQLEAKEEITPDSTKSTQDKISETATDAKERVTRGLQPDDSKSSTQEAFDRAQRAKDNNNGGASESLFDKAKNAVGLGDH
ncbi:hypothetical protein AWENTII_004914 [Aspergillus wentii]